MALNASNMTKKVSRKSDRGKLLTDNAFRDVNRYEPERVRIVREKFGEKRANRMKAAIALDDARRKGVKV